MLTLQYFNILVQILIIVGALNWGLIALLKVDLVEKVTMENEIAEQSIKGIVGAAGLYSSYLLYLSLSK